jgi:hypothetical protein
MLNSLILAFLLAVLTVPSAFAQSVPATSTAPVSYPISTVRNISTMGVIRVAPGNVQSFALAHTIGGLVESTAITNAPLPSGQTFPVTVKSVIPKASAAAAIGRFMQKSLPLLSTGYALYDLSQELGFGLDNSSGTTVVSQVQTTSGCEAFSGHSALLTNFMACGGPYTTPALPILVRVLNTCTAQDFCTAPHDPTYPHYNVYLGPAVAVTTSAVVTTREAFVDAVATRSNWPTTSALSRATKQAIESGESIDATPESVTGPASTPGPISTSQTGDVTSQTSTDYQHSYSGPNVSTTVVTNSTTFTTSTGDTISSTTTTVTPEVPGKTETEPFELPCGIPGKPACDVKVDETGTPTESVDTFGNSKTGLDTIRPAYDTAITGIEATNAPAWTWSFALPTGCAPINLPAFGFSADVCQFQPTIHDLMSLVWIAAGIFGLLGLLGRAFGGTA